MFTNKYVLVVACIASVTAIDAWPTGAESPSQVVPGEVVRLPANTAFERYVVGESVSAVASSERVIYSNTLGMFKAELGANRLVADDIATTAPNGCNLRRYEFPVVGKVNPAGIGGPYTVEFALYDNCPGAVPLASRPTLIIPGTQGQAVFADDARRLISFVVPQGVDIPIPTNVWLGVKFNRNNAGVIVGAPAMVGFSADTFDFPGFPCSADFGGFPDNPQASFRVEIFGDAACPEAFVGYKSNRPSGSIFNPGAGVTFADDIELGVSECQMIAYEVAIKGLGFYSFDFRERCDGGVVPGTSKFLISGYGGDVSIARFSAEPPIPLPPDVWFAATINVSTAGLVVAGVPAVIGQTDDSLGVLGELGCSIADVPGAGVWAALNVAITCAGVPPKGACCDTGARTCLESIPQSQCYGIPGSRYGGDDSTCTTIDPPCEQARGSCCDQTTGVCLDDVVPQECVQDQRDWLKDVLCVDRDPPCAGACCDFLTGVCAETVPPSACAGAQQRWTGGATCSEVVCEAVTGACCDHNPFGGCADGITRAECDCAKCEWTKLGQCADFDCTRSAIPTVDGWGLAVLSLLLLVAAKIRFGRAHASNV